MTILPIVEGHGEVEAVPIALRRIGSELLDIASVEVMKPIRIKRGRLVKREHLGRAIGYALLKLQESASEEGAILVLLDGDGEPPCILGPRVQSMANELRADADVFCVIAHLEYETWFVAAAESLVESGDLVLREGEAYPEDPEGQALRKGWIEKRLRDQRSGYSPTVDQPRFTAKMDLRACRSRSPSFDKLCRELAKRRPR